MTKTVTRKSPKSVPVGRQRVGRPSSTRVTTDLRIPSTNQDLTVISDPFDPREWESTPYLDNVPAVLITLHRRDQSSRHKDLLERLLTDPRMEPAWREIEKRLATLSKQQKVRRRRGRVPASQHKKSKAQKAFEAGFEMTDRDLASWYMESQYENLWREIAYAFVRSGAECLLRGADKSYLKRKPKDRALKPRSWIRARFSRIAKDANRLAEAIADGQLDLLAYELFPDDLARVAFKAQDWSQLAPDARCNRARRALGGALWPSMTDLLGELARRAEHDAHEALATRRMVDRDTGNREFNFFIRHLSNYFRIDLGGPMDAILACLASVVFKTDYDKKSVRRALRHVSR